MSNGLYNSARQLFATGALNWAAGSFDVALVDNTYAPLFANDDTVSDIPSTAILTPFQALSGISVLAGWCKAANVTVPGFFSSTPITGIVIAQNNGGAQGTWPLIAYLDTGSGFGFFGNGNPVSLNWSANGVFQV